MKFDRSQATQKQNIRENGAVEAGNEFLADGQGHSLKDTLLGCVHVEHVTELELVLGARTLTLLAACVCDGNQ